MSWLNTAYRWVTRKVRSLEDKVLENKPPWPPPEDLARLKVYARNENLYEGEHEAVFVTSEDFKWSYDDTREYVFANLLSCLTELLSWRLFGEDVRILAPEDMEATQEFLDHLYDRNQLDSLNLRAAVTGSYRGDTCFSHCPLVLRGGPTGGEQIGFKPLSVP